MQYVSTRGGMPAASFSDVLLEGLAPDGGLVVPEQVPTVTAEELESWRGLSYPEFAAQIIGRFWTDLDADTLAGITARAYGPQFAAPVPVTRVDDRFALLGLSEGPTLAFKDMAMQFLGEAIPYVLKQRGQTLNILGATSGDTGSAAEYAFRSQPRIGVFMLSPQGRMSDFQRAQMYALTDDNVFNIAVEGNFDDCQHLVKELNGDLAFKAAHSLGTVNSINLGRVVAQTVYYFWAVLRTSDHLDAAARSTHRISVAVPSGNFGNIYAGHLAREMGAPIERLVLATNENNVLHEFFTTGRYAPRSREETVITSSPSMDISKASNLERFIYDALGRDAERVGELWNQLDRDGAFDLGDEIAELRDRYGLVSGSSTHADRIATIREVYANSRVIVDPHTADGIHVARQYLAEEPMLVLETAKPQKFAETVTEALGEPAPLTPELEELLSLPQRTIDMAAHAETLRAFIAEHAVSQ